MRGWLGRGAMLVSLIAWGCGVPSPPTPDSEVGEARAAACAEGVVPTTEPATPVTVRHAQGFRVEVVDHAHRVTMTDPWGDGRDFRYLLVPCGTAIPAGNAEARVITVPVARAITTSTTELPAFVMLDVVDRLVGHATFDYVWSPAVRARIDAGDMAEVGHEGSLDIERIIATEPDLVLADTLGSPELDPSGRLGVLEGAGVPVVIVPSFLEATPLGRAEWLKLVALVFDRSTEAASLFDDIERRYEALAAQGRAAVERPTVITGGPAGDIWHVPGGDSYAARLLADAGFDYVFADDASTGSRPLAFEVVHAAGLEADWWIRPRTWASRAEIVGGDARLGALAAFRRGQVVTVDARMNAHGGNDYWESGTARPDWVLEDLQSLAQPDLVPGHTLRFHRILGLDE